MKFTVTDKAGAWVAGRRVAPGDVLDLTEEQASYELTLGTLKPTEAPKPAPSAEEDEARPARAKK